MVAPVGGAGGEQLTVRNAAANRFKNVNLQGKATILIGDSDKLKLARVAGRQFDNGDGVSLEINHETSQAVVIIDRKR